MHLSLAICDHCDTVHQRTQIPRGTRAHCHRCGGELYSNRTTDVTALLAFSLSALIVFVIANAFPIVVVELGGEQTQTTLLGAVATSYQSGMAAIAGLAGLPEISVPIPGEDPIPLGMSIIGARGRDTRLLDAARRIDQSLSDLFDDDLG